MNHENALRKTAISVWDFLAGMVTLLALAVIRQEDFFQRRMLDGNVFDGDLGGLLDHGVDVGMAADTHPQFVTVRAEIGHAVDVAEAVDNGWAFQSQRQPTEGDAASGSRWIRPLPGVLRGMMPTRSQIASTSGRLCDDRNTVAAFRADFAHQP